MSGVACQASHVRVAFRVSHVTFNSQTVRARKLKFFKVRSLSSHLLYVMFHMSSVTCHLICFYKVVKLVDDRVLIKRATLSRLKVVTPNVKKYS